MFLLQSSTSVKDWLPLLSVAVTLLLFIVDRLIGIGIRRREVERNWYLKVLIEPNIKRIDEFFESVGVIYETASIELKELDPVNELYNTRKAEHFEKFLDIRRHLFANLIQPLTPRYFVIAENLTVQLNDIYDDYTGSLDMANFSDEQVNDFKLRVFNMKAESLNLLYVPLGNRRLLRKLEKLASN